MTDHTPGPWTIERYGDGSSLVIHSDAENRICFMATATSDRPSSHAAIRANARLIAAAPDLYDVAKAYEAWEADLIRSVEAWGGAFPGGSRALPIFTQALWDRLLEIQALRNAALSRASDKAGEPE